MCTGGRSKTKLAPRCKVGKPRGFSVRLSANNRTAWPVHVDRVGRGKRIRGVWLPRMLEYLFILQSNSFGRTCMAYISFSDMDIQLPCCLVLRTVCGLPPGQMVFRSGTVSSGSSCINRPRRLPYIICTREKSFRHSPIATKPFRDSSTSHHPWLRD